MASMVPYAVMALSALLSAADSADYERHGGGGAKIKKYDVLDKNQKKLHKYLSQHPEIKMPDIRQNQNFQGGSQYLRDIVNQDPEMMKKFEAPYMRQFNEEIIPSITNRFSGNQRSGGFQQTMGQAGASLMERLAAFKTKMGMDASQQLLGYSQVPFDQQYKNQLLNTDRQRLALGTPAYGTAVQGATPSATAGLQSSLANAGSSMAMMEYYNSLKNQAPSTQVQARPLNSNDPMYLPYQDRPAY